MTDAFTDFCAVLANGPLLKADAIVCLCGEDAEPRVTVACQLFRSGAAPYLVLSGGKNEPPRIKGAESCFGLVMSQGIAFERIIGDYESQHTRDQAVNVVALAAERQWTQLLLVASPYHAPRAFMTFVQAMDEAKVSDKIRLVNAPASQTLWSESPDATSDSRLSLWRSECHKIATYTASGHVATAERGLEYLLGWERR